MGSSDNFCLRWNDFATSISSSFRKLRRNNSFIDITLCCDNGTDCIGAHKIILAACSPLFNRILNKTVGNSQNSSPLLYLKGIHKRELQAVLDFMYHGEVSVTQDSLNAFLSVAEELDVIGLTPDSKLDSDNSDIGGHIDDNQGDDDIFGNNTNVDSESGERILASTKRLSGVADVKRVKIEPSGDSSIAGDVLDVSIKDGSQNCFESSAMEDDDMVKAGSSDNGGESGEGMAESPNKWRSSHDSSRKYNSKWEETFDWLQKATDESESAYCKLCHCNIMPRISSLSKHEQSDKHKTRSQYKEQTNLRITTSNGLVLLRKKEKRTAKYLQAFKDSWTHDNNLKDWVVRSDDAYTTVCKYCKSTFNCPKKGDLLRHKASKTHQRAVNAARRLLKGSSNHAQESWTE